MRGNNILLVALALISFVISGVLLIKGIGNHYANRDMENEDVVNVDKDDFVDEEVELSGYFEGYYESDDDPDSYARNDPFRDVCSQVDAEEGTAVVYSNIVCFK